MAGFGFGFRFGRKAPGKPGKPLPVNALSLDGTDALILSLDGTDAMVLVLESIT
jgi:hypothetical protein